MAQQTEESGQENRKKQKKETSKSSSTTRLIIKKHGDGESGGQLSLRASESVRSGTQSGEGSPSVKIGCFLALYMEESRNPLIFSQD